MPNAFVFRLSPPEAEKEHFEEMFREKFSGGCVVLVREYGEEGNHLHYHGYIETDKDQKCFRKFLNYHFKLSGNSQLSVKTYNPQKGAGYWRYLAKGPQSKRLQEPEVVMDSRGMNWRVLHHSYHDEAVIQASKKRKREDRKSFADRCEDYVCAQGARTEREILKCILDFISKDSFSCDKFIIVRLVNRIHARLNPVEFHERMYREICDYTGW